MKWWIMPAIIASSACASSPWDRADCTRYRYHEYNVLACNDQAVGKHCKIGSVEDVTRKPVNYYPRGCMIRNSFGRKDTIMIGRSYMSCLPHEICHQEYPNDDAWCEQRYPCVSDARKH